SRLNRRWCLAPVRTDAPGPPPQGVERRTPERIALELAGECLGRLMDGVNGAGQTGPGGAPADEDVSELEDFFDHASIGMHFAGPDGIIVRVNQAELDLFGYAREEYLGHPVADFHVDPAAAEEALRRVRTGETVHNLEARVRRKDGAIRTVLISSNARFQD